MTERTRQPYLVQRVLLRENANGGKGVDGVFAFDYMGSAEFEFGALGVALRAMRANKANLVSLLLVHDKYRCTFLGLDSDTEIAEAFFADQLNERCKLRLKEASNVRGAYTGDKYDAKIIGWWALDQDCPWLLFKDATHATAWMGAL